MNEILNLILRKNIISENILRNKDICSKIRKKKRFNKIKKIKKIYFVKF
jgi:hypothetical protein